MVLMRMSAHKADYWLKCSIFVSKICLVIFDNIVVLVVSFMMIKINHHDTFIL